MFRTMQLKKENITKDVIASHYNNSIFILLNSLELGFVPKIGDKILDNEHCFIIKSIMPMITGKNELDNFALDVEEIQNEYL
ncbi:MAG: hypothetical protein K6F04_00150 [bacterium]|nr:hypothetical protein [bacterium]